MENTDVLILGGGPAGLAAADAVSAAGFRVVVVEPAPDRVWTPFYGMWRDEAASLGLEDVLAEAWEAVEVRFGAAHVLPLGRTYTRIDNHKLQTRWRRGTEERGGRMVTGRVVRIMSAGALSHVQLEDGSVWGAWQVLDASGTPRVTTDPSSRANVLAQSAFGVVLRPRRVPADLRAARLMDYGHAAPSEETPPSFLYALPLHDGNWLLEETVLASSPALSAAQLRARLSERLSAMGVEGEVLAEEDVYIPLDVAPPSVGGDRIWLGSVAGLINPLSGYLLPAAIRHARQVARLLVEGKESGRSPGEIRRLVHERTWNAQRSLERHVRLFGIRVLAPLDGDDTRAFLRSLFDGRSETWRSLLGHDTPPRALLGAMWRAFWGFPMHIKIKALFRLSRHPALLAHLFGLRPRAVPPLSRSPHAGRAANPHA